MESAQENYLKKAKGKTQIELINHLFEHKGSMLIKHRLKINKAMQLADDYPDHFEWSYYSMYPMTINLKIKGVYFNE